MKITLREITPGKKLSSLLHGNGIGSPMPCGGTGKCGRCKVKVCQGTLRLPDGSEITVSPEKPVCVKSCSTFVLSDAVTIEASTAPDLYTEKRFVPQWETAKAVPGTTIAVDLGTTTIAAVMISDGKVIAAAGITNPQRQYGDNIIDRIAAASDSAEKRSDLQDLILKNALPGIFDALPLRDAAPVQRIVVAGNTAMSCLTAGIPAASLGYAPFTAPAVDFPVRQMFIESTGSCSPLEFFPAAAGFIGGDTIAGLYACGFLETENDDVSAGPELFVDLGTNCEIVLKKNGRFYGTTAAAGPAFERYAAAAAPGVIDRTSVVPGAVRYHTIGDMPPCGICGAALLSLVAELLRLKVLDRSGRFDEGALKSLHLAAETPHGTACRITPELLLTGELVAELITAKAAVSAGITAILKKAGVAPQDIRRTVLAGGFAANLNIRDALSTGLLPLPPETTFETPGNAALAGCAKAAALGCDLKKTASCRERFTVINLAEETVFADAYPAALSF